LLQKNVHVSLNLKNFEIVLSSKWAKIDEQVITMVLNFTLNPDFRYSELHDRFNSKLNNQGPGLEKSVNYFFSGSESEGSGNSYRFKTQLNGLFCIQALLKNYSKQFQPFWPRLLSTSFKNTLLDLLISHSCDSIREQAAITIRLLLSTYSKFFRSAAISSKPFTSLAQQLGEMFTFVFRELMSCIAKSQNETWIYVFTTMVGHVKLKDILMLDTIYRFAWQFHLQDLLIACIRQLEPGDALEECWGLLDVPGENKDLLFTALCQADPVKGWKHEYNDKRLYTFPEDVVEKRLQAWEIVIKASVGLDPKDDMDDEEERQAQTDVQDLDNSILNSKDYHLIITSLAHFFDSSSTTIREQVVAILNWIPLLALKQLPTRTAILLTSTALHYSSDPLPTMRLLAITFLDKMISASGNLFLASLEQILTLCNDPLPLVRTKSFWVLGNMIVLALHQDLSLTPVATTVAIEGLALEKTRLFALRCLSWLAQSTSPEIRDPILQIPPEQLAYYAISGTFKQRWNTSRLILHTISHENYTEYLGTLQTNLFAKNYKVRAITISIINKLPDNALEEMIILVQDMLEDCDCEDVQRYGLTMLENTLELIRGRNFGVCKSIEHRVAELKK
jgi:hypothetical protein